MKALSLHPDNAAAVAWGDKLVEYRTWQTKYRGPLLICASAKKIPGYLAGHALCVMNLEGIYRFPDGSYGWRFSPYQTGTSYHIEPFPVKGRQRLFEVEDRLIRPVKWENDGQVDLEAAHQWFDHVYQPLIIKNKWIRGLYSRHLRLHALQVQTGFKRSDFSKCLKPVCG